MSAVERAIELAVTSGGFDAGLHVEFYAGARGHRIDPSKCLLDPLFWRTLGKGLGTDKHDQPNGRFSQWLFTWHAFIGHLANGKDAESFFQELLPDKE